LPLVLTPIFVIIYPISPFHERLTVPCIPRGDEEGFIPISQLPASFLYTQSATGFYQLTHKFRIGFSGKLLTVVIFLINPFSKSTSTVSPFGNTIYSSFAFQQGQADINGIAEEDTGKAFGDNTGNA